MRKGTFRRILCGVLAALCAVIFFVPDVKANAESTPLDEIEKYQITLSDFDKGEFRAEYLITWTVLDSSSEGPLTWVKIPNPLSNMSDITPATGSVSSARYCDTSEEDYVRVDLDRPYYAGETVTFGFSCRLKPRYYTDDDGVIVALFSTGWFNDIAVDEYEIRWDADQVSYAYPEYEEVDGYYVWRGSLRPGEEIKLHIEYPDSAGIEMPRDMTVLGVVLFFVAAGVLCAGDIFLRRRVGRYMSMRIGGHYHGGGFGGGCACACACACAGGGRAGCSAKDFYGTKVSSAKVRARLKKRS